MLTQDLTITIPSEVKRALRIPERELADRLSLELAVHLYEEWLLPFGKAAELAQAFSENVHSCFFKVKRWFHPNA